MSRMRHHMAAHHAHVLRDKLASADAIISALDWIAADPENKLAFDSVERFLELCGDLPQQSDAPGALITSWKSVGAPTRPWQKASAWWSLAASLALLFAGAGGWQLYQRLGRPVQLVQLRYESPVRQSRELMLPDGSRVTLGGASAIGIAFDDRVRRIALTRGEAIFEVTHDERRPFVVSANGGSVTAVGTEFDVRLDPGGTTVSVVRGTVNVVSMGESATVIAQLRRSMQVRYRPNGTMSAVSWIDLDGVTAWRRGELHFNEEPLASVVAALNRYSLEPIEIDSPMLGDLPVSGVVSLKDILRWIEGMSSVSSIEVIHKNGAIHLRERHSQSQML